MLPLARAKGLAPTLASFWPALRGLSSSGSGSSSAADSVSSGALPNGAAAPAGTRLSSSAAAPAPALPAPAAARAAALGARHAALTMRRGGGGGSGGTSAHQWAPARFLGEAAPLAPPPAPGGRVVAFPLAQTGEGISECELVTWHVKEGDAVEAFQPVCEVQSDKAAVEITSRYPGTVQRLHHPQGAMVKVGAPLLDILVADDVAVDEAATPIVGGELSAAAAGGANSDSTCGHNGNHNGSVDAPADDVAHAAAAAVHDLERPVLASPAVRGLARELGVRLGAVCGSGPGGRVLKEDVIAAAERAVGRGGGGGGGGGGAAAAAAVSAAATALGDAALALGRAPAAAAMAAAEDAPLPPPAPTPGFAAPLPPRHAAAVAAAPREPTRVPLRGYRRAMVKSSLEAAAIPTFHYTDELELDALMAARAELQSEAAPLLGGVKLTFMPFILKALSVALARYPALNSQLAPGGGELLQLHAHNVGVAMATPAGLVVPNVKAVRGGGGGGW